MKAFNERMETYRPDHYSDADKDYAKQKTQEILEAYRTLSNAASRAEYDGRTFTEYNKEPELASGMSGTVDATATAAAATADSQTVIINGQPAGAYGAKPAKPENYGAGLLGALLFALGGGVIWGVIYYFGYLSAIAGILTIFLAGLGYKKFGHVQKLSLAHKIICLVITVVVGIIAMYCSTAVELHSAYADWYAEGSVDYTLTYFECLRYLPIVLQDVGIGSYIADLGISLGLSAIYFIGWLFTEK
jgi:curved DNA-binding protein CbpA